MIRELLIDFFVGLFVISQPPLLLGLGLILVLWAVVMVMIAICHDKSIDRK